MEPAKAHAVETYSSQAFTLTHIAARNARLSHAVLRPAAASVAIRAVIDIEDLACRRHPGSLQVHPA